MTTTPVHPADLDPAGAEDDGRIREDLTFRVRPASAPDTEWQIRGELLVPAQGADTVQVLLPGLTYDRRYWTVPGRYDYAGHMLRAGYAVLLIDRLGTGASSRPAATDVTVDSNVETIHHVIQELRSGTPGGHSFDKVVSVGHSFGSGLAIVEAARHADVDALVVTGMLHTMAPLYDEVINFFHPGSEDPVISDPDLPQWYMTQRPGLRARMLEHAEGIDPELSAHNELIKATATLGEGESLPQTYLAEYSQAVKVPVLLVVGEHDALFSSADVAFAADSESVHAFEQSFYAPEAELETHVIAGTGHSLTVHRTAPESYALTERWLNRKLSASA
ncbi:alpha/beta hydrolase [Streptomyces sp. NPDC097619]|uniref:alpha/beta hydrolase n=1 Tax=Streptomyces sp. NPDC097619 TaxID=3157228 RepID=UPI0033348A90